MCIAWVQEEGLRGVLRSFYSDNEFGVYRPVSIHVYYYLCRFLFDLQPLGYHLASLTSQVLNVLLVATLGLLVTHSRWVAFLAGTAYLSRLSHYIGVFWAAGINEVWLALFYLLALTSFVLYSKKGSPAYLWCALLGFVLALASKESAVTLPFVLLAYGLVFKGRPGLRAAVQQYGPFFAILAAYLVLKLVIFKPMVGTTYEVGAGIWIIRNFFSYLVFQVNLTHLALVAFKLFADINLYSFLINEKMTLSFIGIAALSVIMGLHYSRASLSAKMRDLDVEDRLILFSLLFFLISLFPALLMKNRVQQYYLFVPSIAFSLACAALLKKFVKTRAAGVAVTVIMLAGAFLGYSWLERIPDGRTTTSAKIFLEDMNSLIERNPDIQGMHVEGGTMFMYQVLWCGDAFKSFLSKPISVTFDFQLSNPPTGEGIVRVRLDGERLREQPGF